MKKVLFLLFLFSLGACTNDDIQKMHDEVMAIHDEVMPRMSEIATYRDKVEERLSLPDSSLSSAREELENGLRELAAAKQGMVSWMQNYEKPDEDMGRESALAYLSEQKDAISKVKTDIEGSINLAKLLLNE